ncbi:MAG: COP23 domain-containing protein [Thermosynechococcaceae cyanobacterium]
MKLKKLVPILAVSAITYAATLATDSAAAAEQLFSCGQSGGVPSTMAKTSRGMVPVIKWSSDYFNNSGYSSVKRCQIVSDKFQQYYETGELNYLTTGRLNRQDVVCVAKARLGACSGVLFTLKPGSNPGRTLQRLMDVRLRASGPLNETSERVYIKFDDFLNEAPVDASAAVPPQASASPVNQPKSTAPTPATGLW